MATVTACMCGIDCRTLLFTTGCFSQRCFNARLAVNVPYKFLSCYFDISYHNAELIDRNAAHLSNSFLGTTKNFARLPPIFNSLGPDSTHSSHEGNKFMQNISSLGPQDSHTTSKDNGDDVFAKGEEEQAIGQYGGGDGGGHNDDKRRFSGGEGGDGSSEEESEFGPIMSAVEVNNELQTRGISLPPDMTETVHACGIRQLLFYRYLDLQGAQWPLGPAIRSFPMLRNRMLADPSFVFKVLTEIVIDAGCATFAEVQKRGKDFWNEFEFYCSDLAVGIVLDVALVGMLAPLVQFGGRRPVTGIEAKLSRAIQALPSSMFEAARPGRSFSLQQRVATLFYKALQYGLAGFTCGVVGQGIASNIMILKRKMRRTEEDQIKVPPIVRTAAVWGAFMALSSNTRYQIINGLEQVVEASPLSRRVPQVALAFTVGIRFANNIFAGMQFVDWAKSAGVQ